MSGRVQPVPDIPPAPFADLGLQPLLAVVKDPLLVLAPDGTLIAINASAAELFDEPPLAGCSIWSFLPQGSVYDYTEAVGTAFSRCRPLRFESPIRDRWYDISVEPLVRAAGQPFALMIHGRDITEKKAAAALRQSNDLLVTTIIDLLPQWIYWKDRHGRFLGCNRAFARAVGLSSPSDIRGKTDLDVFPPERVARMRPAEAEYPLECRARMEVEELDLPTGHWTLRSLKQPLLDDSGTQIGMLVVAEPVPESGS